MAVTKTPSRERAGKTPAVPVSQDAGHPFLLVAVQPGIDRIRVSWLQEPVPGNRVRAHAIGDLQQGGTALPDLGMRMVIPFPLEACSGPIVEVEVAIERHGCGLLSCRLPYYPPTDFHSQS
jgi:hypothetical protein